MLILAAASIVVFNAYTNHAGNVVFGNPVGISARNVQLQGPEGRVGYPLSIFPAHERRRLAVDAGRPELPAEVAQAVEGHRKAVARSRKRAEKGLCTEAESDRFVTAARAAMDTYLKSQTDGGRLYGFESKWIRKDIGL